MPNEALATFDGTARAVWLDRDLLYVGGEDYHLHVLDAKSGRERKAWKLPYLVSDVAAIGDRVFAALGPGVLVTWSKRGLDAAGEQDEVDVNAPRFAVHRETLFWGTAWGELHELGRGLVAKVKGSLCAVAPDAQHVYCGYDDGKVRVFRRSDGKRVKLVAVAGHVARCALAGDRLVTVDQHSGEIEIWGLPGFERERSFVHDVTGHQYGVIGIWAAGSRVATHSYTELRIHELDGSLVTAWTAPEGRLEDVWLDGDRVLACAGNSLYRFSI